MCGISGIIRAGNGATQEQQVHIMMKAMKHRGPDDEGCFREAGVELGFVRLSIIDLSSAGRQPMHSSDGRYVLIFNGEIFNYIELREELEAAGYYFRTKTDTEVLLIAFQAWGEKMLHRLNGMWAFVIYDRKEKTLFGARDRYGIKPFYYSMDEGRFLFASEIPPILSVLGRKPTPDLSTIFDLLVFNRSDQTDSTAFVEVQKLNHGHAFKLRVGESLPSVLPVYKWYDLKNELKEPFQDPEEFKEMLSSSIELRLRSDVPVGVCLSGGLDSSSIVSLLLQDFRREDINTFSAIYGKGKYGDESAFINLYNGQLKNKYFINPDEFSLIEDIDAFVRAQAEPTANSNPYAQYKVMQLAKDHVTVTLDGQGADEELAGYHYFFGFYFKDLLLKGQWGKLSYEVSQYCYKHRSVYGLKSLLFFLFPEKVRTRLRAMERGYLSPEFYQAHAHNSTAIAGELYGSSNLQEALINHFEFKLEHLLKYEDRNSMCFSMEARVPFLDYRLVERTLSLGNSLIIKEGMTKHILREAMRGILPEPIRLRRDKIGFGTPQDEWFRTPIFQQYITALIHDPRFASRGIMDVQKAREIFRKHLNRQGNYSREIWKWINLEHWFRAFVD